MENFQTPNQTPASSKMRVSILAIAILLLVLALALAFYYFRSVEKQPESVTTMETGEIMTTAAEGELVSDFPKELIIGSDGIEDSYSIQYVSDNVELPVASFRSKTSLSESVAAYGNYLKENGWTIVHEADPTLSLTFWYATKELQDINVTIQDREGVVYVNVALTNRIPTTEESI